MPNEPVRLSSSKLHYLLAKLRAAMEMEEALEACKQLAIDRVRVADLTVKKDIFAADALMGIAKAAKDAQAAWQQAGEEGA